jgi:hypothetical protein
VLEFSFFRQIVQVLPSIGLTLLASLIMLLGMRITNTGILQLILVPTLGIIVYLATSYATKRPELNEIIDLVTGMKRRLKKKE